MNPVLRIDGPNTGASEFGKGLTLLKQTGNTLDLLALHRTKSGIFDTWGLNAIRVHRNLTNNIHTSQVQ
jgi:hypothetical protein